MGHAHHDVLLFLFARDARLPAGLFAILLRHFLFAGNRLGRTFARACIGVRTLAANGKALAVAQAAIAAKIHQPLDVHRHFAAQITFDHDSRDRSPRESG